MTPKTIRTAGDKTLYIYQLGDDQKNITLVLASPLPDVTLLPGVHVIVEDSVSDDFCHWLGHTLVEDAAKNLGSKARVGRLREALGVQAYTLKTAKSPTTQWRRRKRRQEDEEMI